MGNIFNYYQFFPDTTFRGLSCPENQLKMPSLPPFFKRYFICVGKLKTLFNFLVSEYLNFFLSIYTHQNIYIYVSQSSQFWFDSSLECICFVTWCCIFYICFVFWKCSKISFIKNLNVKVLLFSLDFFVPKQLKAFLSTSSVFWILTKEGFLLLLLKSGMLFEMKFLLALD